MEAKHLREFCCTNVVQKHVFSGVGVAGLALEDRRAKVKPELRRNERVVIVLYQPTAISFYDYERANVTSVLSFDSVG